MTDLAWDSFYRLAAPSRSRGAAAGPIDPKSEYWKKRTIVENKGWWATYKNGNKTSKMRVNNTVFSSVVGYFEKTPFMKLPCRLTSYTQTFFDEYKKGIPFIQEIDKVFKQLTPGPYQKQLDRIKATPKYRIADTAFSSVTINRNFRTALHQDAGDFKDGYGNLSVLERGKYHGETQTKSKVQIPSWQVGKRRTSRQWPFQKRSLHVETPQPPPQEEESPRARQLPRLLLLPALPLPGHVRRRHLLLLRPRRAYPGRRLGEWSFF
jgi:hypothetical protein